MNELIKVKVNKNNEQVVSGRDLHEFLEINTPYTMWFKRMLEYGFEENIDYMTDNKNVSRVDGVIMPQKEINHILKMDMAKEICMIQRTEKGRKARRYFIEVEKAWNDPQKVLERANNIQKRVDISVGKHKRQRPLLNYILDYMDFGDVDFMASMYNISPEMLLRILEKENLIYFNQIEQKYYLNNDNRHTEGFLVKDDWDDWALSKTFLLKIYEVMEKYGIKSQYDM